MIGESLRVGGNNRGALPIGSNHVTDSLGQSIVAVARRGANEKSQGALISRGKSHQVLCDNDRVATSSTIAFESAQKLSARSDVPRFECFHKLIFSPGLNGCRARAGGRERDESTAIRYATGR